MATVSVTVRMDKELKAEAEALFEELGLTFTSAITMFVRQAVREGGIPFTATTKPGSGMVCVPCRDFGPRYDYAVVELPEVGADESES